MNCLQKFLRKTALIYNIDKGLHICTHNASSDKSETEIT
jgi:hypothetical protein